MNDFEKYLFSFQDLKYKEFHSSLVLNSKYEIIGIRTPIMKEIAKEVSKNDVIEFLENVKDNYYEEILIQGLVISKIKDEEVFYKYFKKHIPKIDNWALCDSFCNSIKIVRKYKDKYFSEAVKMALIKGEFKSRVGLVMILSHFVSLENLSVIFDMLNKINSDKFYINMAEAWLVCELYIKYPEETKKFLIKNNLNCFTLKKAVSKICDSFRVTDNEKKELKEILKKVD